MTAPLSKPITIAPATRRWLLFLARRALAAAFEERYGPGHPLPMEEVERPGDPLLEEAHRIFVTWRDGEELVGCIGILEPRYTLEEAVPRYATLAAMEDPRTPTPHPAQWDDLHCSISVLTPAVELDVTGLAAITRAVEPFRHGVAIQYGHKRALLLPSVWDNLPEPTRFMAALTQKAGIDPVEEGPMVKGSVFEAIKFGER